MIKKSSIPFFFCLLFAESFASNYYVSTTGNDNNNGISQNTPYKTIEKSLTVAVSGDVIYVGAGTYTYATGGTLKITQSNLTLMGQTGAGGSRPLLDFSAMSLLSSNYGIVLSGSNSKVYGLDIKGAGDNGISISGSNNIVEFCSFFENRDTGCQLKGGASNNQIINCDSYYNVDAAQGNADGFAGKLDVGTGNIFKGCRAWQNSDDGWDGYLRPADDITSILENCWCFKNGYLKDGSASQGNGNGYKIGGSDNKDLRHNFILRNCLAFDNRVKGYDQNNNKGSMTLLNCTAINNGIDYSIDGTILASGKSLTVTNCVTPNTSTANIALKGGTMTTNSWQSPFSCTNADFQSTTITIAQATAARKSDGSLPEITFMHLVKGSDLIDVGTNVGLPFNGTKPDLGCFETAAIVSGIDLDDVTNAASFVYPNPTTGIINIKTNVVNNSSIRIYNSVGEMVKEESVLDEFTTLHLDGYAPGFYMVHIRTDGKTLHYPIVLEK